MQMIKTITDLDDQEICRYIVYESPVGTYRFKVMRGEMLLIDESLDEMILRRMEMPT